MWAPEEGVQKQPLLGDNFDGPLPADPNWNGVKTEKRSFKDVVFGFLFLLVFVACLGIGILGYTNGDPSSLPPLKDNGDLYEKAEEIGVTWGTKAIAMLKQDLGAIIGALCAAVVLAFAWTQAMKWFTKAFIYIMLIGGIAGLVGLGIYMFQLSASKNTNSDLQYIAYICWGAAVILLIATFLLRNKIALTASLMKEACRSLQHNPALFIVSLIIIALFLVFAAFWISSFVYLYSVPEKNFHVGGDKDASSSDANYAFSASYRNLMWFQVFAGLWTVALLSAMFQHAIAGGIAAWYFTQAGGQKIHLPAFKALGWGFTTSFGSLAFGSLIVAIISFINFLLEKAKQSNRKNKALKMLLSCVQCCLGSLKSIVEWVNKFAFIYVAMHGEGFCTSARGVWKLISRNFFSTVIVDVMSDFVLFVGKILGTAIITVGTVAIIDVTKDSIGFLSVAVIAVATFAIFHLFANIISTGVDTILICYLEDLERNRDGALHMNVELHDLLQKKTEKARADGAAGKV